jgi:hypothetical protein
MARRHEPVRASAAGILAALATLAKLSAVWAPLAIFVWLLVRSRRSVPWFVVAYLVTFAGLLGVFAVWSKGRVLENVFGLAGAGIGGLGAVMSAPYRLFHLGVQDATAAWFLVPLVVVGVWWLAARRELGVWTIALGAAVVNLLVVLTDAGTGWNQLVDIVVLVSLALGELWSRLEGLPSPAWGQRMVTVTLAWVLATGFAVTVVPDAVPAAASVRTQGLGGQPLPEAIVDRFTADSLSEDPLVPVVLGHVPVILDPFMVLRIGERDPRALADLIRRIGEQEFDVVVLVEDLAGNPEWWREYHFGASVAEALRASYVLDEEAGGYRIYAPRAGGTAS